MYVIMDGWIAGGDQVVFFNDALLSVHFDETVSMPCMVHACTYVHELCFQVINKRGCVLWKS
jgi:hypothetical protein